MIIGVIGAMQIEIEDLLKDLGDYTETKTMGISFYEAKLNDNDIIITQSGVGKVNAAIATILLVNNFDCGLIINTGIAGGVGLNTEDVVIATSLKYHDFDTTVFGYKKGQVPGLPEAFIVDPELVMITKKTLKKLDIDYKCCNVYSGDQFVSSKEQIKDIPDTEFACEMEGAGVAHAALKANVGFIVLRYISDIVGKDSQLNDYKEFETKMAHRSSKICLKLLSNLE